MNKKPGDHGDDLAEFKELIGSEPSPVDEEISLDSIMAEYKYESVTKRRRPPSAAPVSDDTARLMKVAEEMKKFARSAESMRQEQTPGTQRVGEQPAEKYRAAEKAETSPEPLGEKARGGFEEPFAPELEEAFFGLPDDFQKAFSPSGDFVGSGSMDEDEPSEHARPKKSILKALRRHLRRKIEPEETTPEQACAKLTPYVAALRLRAAVALFLFLPLLYITFAQPYGWPMPAFITYREQPYTYLLVTALLQILVMLCGTDIIARGFSDLYHLRPGTETLISISCLASILNVLSIVAFANEVKTLADGSQLVNGFIGFLPYSAVSAGSVFFGLMGHYTMLNARRRSYKTASAVSDPDIVTLEDRLWDDLSGFSRKPGGTAGFVTRTELPDMAQRTMSFLAPLLIIASLVLAFMVSFGQGKAYRFFWAWSAISASAAPFGAMLPVALPFSKVAKRLEHMRAAIAGWSAAKSFSEGTFAVVGDIDLFPGDMVTLNGLKVFGRYSYEKVTSIAASLLAVSGSGIYRALSSVSSTPSGGLRSVTSFEHYEGGGVGGEIDGDRVLLGSSAFLLRMGIRLPKELNIKNAVFVAVNMDIAGIFAINYIPDEDVEAALHLLERHSITAVLAVRDFNISPLMLKKLFGIDSERLEYPPIEDRLALSDPDREISGRPAAVLTREGLTPYAESIVGGSRLHRISKINLFVNVISTLGGLFLSFLLAYLGTSEMSLAPHNMVMYMLLWLLLVTVISQTASKY